jgi:hypothetical protein
MRPWLAWLLAFGLAGCAAARPASLEGAGEGPAATPALEAARLERELQRLEAALGTPDPGARQGDRPDCERACELGRRICALAGRICLLAAVHGEAEIQARCEDAQVRCSRSRALTEAACGCRRGPGDSVP